jgi:ribosomal protein S18 acetylase RimI-like enzyme
MIRTSIHIVPFQISHQTGVDAMLLSIGEEFSENILSPAYKKMSEVYSLPGRRYWVAMAGDMVVGTVGIVAVDSYAMLKAMFVHRDYRGGEQRVAWQLLQKAIAHAEYEAAERLYLGTMGQFKAAQRFYEKNGFIRIEESALPAGYPENSIDTVFYQLKLS